MSTAFYQESERIALNLHVPTALIDYIRACHKERGFSRKDILRRQEEKLQRMQKQFSRASKYIYQAYKWVNQHPENEDTILRKKKHFQEILPSLQNAINKRTYVRNYLRNLTDVEFDAIVKGEV